MLEFSRLLRKTPKVGDDGKTTDEAVKELWEERFLFILADGDPSQLAADICEQNLVSQTSSSTPSYKHAGGSTPRETSARSSRPPHQGRGGAPPTPGSGVTTTSTFASNCVTSSGVTSKC
ncbi:hypothetical protein GS532_22305 [Rhodococcus hoagii]|nr:hypothetical protein [Prescottella equi]